MKAGSVVFAALVVLGTGTAVAADPPRFKVFGAVSYVAPLGEGHVTIGDVRDSVQASNELGWNVGFEIPFSSAVGLEFDYTNATNDIEFGGRVVGSVHMQPLSATLNFHVLPGKVVDLYFGPTASYFMWGDVDLDTGERFKTDNQFTYGASLGLDIGLGDTFAIIGGLRWLKADIEPEGTGKIGVDPLFSRLGVALRF